MVNRLFSCSCGAYNVCIPRLTHLAIPSLHPLSCPPGSIATPLMCYSALRVAYDSSHAPALPYWWNPHLVGQPLGPR
jgi:hypothetical protein